MSEHLWVVDPGREDCGCGCYEPAITMCATCRTSCWPCEEVQTELELEVEDYYIEHEMYEELSEHEDNLYRKYHTDEYKYPGTWNELLRELHLERRREEAEGR